MFLLANWLAVVTSIDAVTLLQLKHIGEELGETNGLLCTAREEMQSKAEDTKRRQDDMHQQTVALGAVFRILWSGTCDGCGPPRSAEKSWPARQSDLPPGAAQRSRTRWPGRGARAIAGSGDAPSSA